MKWDDEEGFIELADLDEDLEIPELVVKEDSAEEPMEWSFDSNEAPMIGNILPHHDVGSLLFPPGLFAFRRRAVRVPLRSSTGSVRVPPPGLFAFRHCVPPGLFTFLIYL
ncbi:hypothetical protein RIF29_25570 [Crotalaria pallida]|uniref:Uncharacterized protein n=1 Tax=Crotalaria pallida TaxID=3830 RepID=A0AAN9EP03_CROPI